MDKDRIEGSANQAKGAIKQAAGKITGDAKLQAEGAADKAKARCRMRSAAPRMRCATLLSIKHRPCLPFWREAPQRGGGRSIACDA